MSLDNIFVVLNEPQGDLNVGSVCRAMMNFGLRNLIFVNPYADHLGLQARKMALKSEFLLDNALVFDDLETALSDFNIAIGTSVRHGKYRKDFFTPDTASEYIFNRFEDNKIALVFGREDSGLSTNDLDLCQHFITIPTDEKFTSMNLSHSVTVVLYEISKIINNGSYNLKRKKLAENSEVENLFDHMKKTLSEIEFLDPQNPDHIMRTFRKIYGRSELDKREVSILHGLMSKIEWFKNK
ncbi:MAG: RNA methyltransferase [Desulfobacterales bacterium]|nr:RNA methyltransferase [Desulfobacterales bacterium]